MTSSAVLGPLTANPCGDAAHAVARALAGSEWEPAGRVEDLGSSAALVIQRGSRRDPGDSASTVDSLQKVRLNFTKEQQ